MNRSGTSYTGRGGRPDRAWSAALSFGLTWLVWAAATASGQEAFPTSASELSAVVENYNRRLIGAGPACAPALPAPLGRWLAAQGYRPQEMTALGLEPRDLAHLRRADFLARVAAGAVAGAETPAERANRLFAFIIREVAPYIPADSFARPEDILIRGYGSCDQGAWALCALAGQLGFEAQLIYLRRPGATESHHTLAALKVAGAWRLYDTFAALDFSRRLGRPADLPAFYYAPAELAARLPAGYDLFAPADLPLASFLVLAEPRADLPRWQCFAQLTADWPGRPVVWLDPTVGAQRLAADFARAREGGAAGAAAEKIPAPQIGIYDFPRQLAGFYDRPDWYARLQETRAYGPWREARRAHLAGRSAEALAGLSPPMGAGDQVEADRLWYLALAAAAAPAAPESVPAVLAELRARFPSSPWVRHSWWLEGRWLSAQGRQAEARAALAQVPLPRQVAVEESADNDF